MSRKKEKSLAEIFLNDFYDMALVAPWWIAPILSIIAFILLRVLYSFFTPKTEGPWDLSILFRGLLPVLSWGIPGLMLLVWLIAEGDKFRRRSKFDKQTGLDSIRDLSWQQFEELVAEAYRRQGYLAEVVGNATGDGGVDVELTGFGQTILVQCKHWKVYRVGVKPVRELLGVVAQRKASKGILITSGEFTEEAKRFASESSILLMNGFDTAALVLQVQQSGKKPKPSVQSTNQTQNIPQIPSTPKCPKCGGNMVRRRAKQGVNAGNEFWGCSNYPNCRGIVPIASNER